MPETDREPAHLSSCECGALRLLVTGSPVHVHGCTCTRCQRGSGSVMRVSAWFPDTDVRIEGPFTTWFYRDNGDPAMTACFCPTCGGGRFFRTGDYLKGCIGIAVGNFADPGFQAPDHIHWWPDRPHWLGNPVGPTLLEGN